MTQTTRKQNPLGRLSALGIKHPWQAALLMPTDWDNLSQPLERFLPQDLDDRPKVVVIGRLSGQIKTEFGKGKPPRTYGYLNDRFGNRLGFSVFGDARELQKEIEKNPERVILYGKAEMFNTRIWLKEIEPIAPNWIGYLRPIYPGKRGVINPALVRERVTALLREAIPQAAKFLEKTISSFGTPERLLELANRPGWTLEQLLWQAHVPQSIEYGRAAQSALDTLAALGIIQNAWKSHGLVRAGAPLPLGDWQARARALPHPLTDEQSQAITDILEDLNSPVPMRRILSGDVGTGKTAVFCAVAATVIDGGGRVVILLPNETLAAQVAQDLNRWWPDLPVELVTGASPNADTAQPLLVGTTALLHRKVVAPDLVIVDEQQKASREQREKLLGPDTHLLEVTATCIPRTQALIRYGITKVSKLTREHTPKQIETRIWTVENWQELFGTVQNTLRCGGQVLLVYPLREKGEPKEDGSQSELRSATEIFQKWQNLYPGQVSLIHGGMDDEEKQASIQAMLGHSSRIMVATTVIECGINLPGLRQVIVVSPQRHGLTTLHQIRGRLARNGGYGRFDLYLPYPIKESTMQRLDVLVKTRDGFAIAEADMRLRGAGDLSAESSRQSGSDESFLFGRAVSIESLDAAMAWLDQNKSRTGGAGSPIAHPATRRSTNKGAESQPV